MEAHVYEANTTTQGTSTTTRGRTSPWISWGAIFGGLASGTASYLLLALLGLAVGLTAINPQSGEPLGKVPLATGIWTGISLIISAFIGGYVAARLSGLSRRTDGLLYGFVSWGISTIFFAYLVTTSVGSVLGGTFNILGQGVKAVAGGAAATAGGVAGSPSAQDQLQSMLKSAGAGTDVSKESISNLQDRLKGGDRDGAISVMVNQMGFREDRATQLVDKALVLYSSGQNMPQEARDVASSAVSGLSAAAWSLFIGLVLSLALGLFGGAAGSRAVDKRRHPMTTVHA